MSPSVAARAVNESQPITLAADRASLSPHLRRLEDDAIRILREVVANALRAPFALGAPPALQALLGEAGIDDAEIGMLGIRARFPSLDAWIHTDIRGWTLSGMIDDGQFQTLLDAGRRKLKRFVLDDGTIAFDAPALLAIAHKR